MYLNFNWPNLGKMRVQAKGMSDTEYDTDCDSEELAEMLKDAQPINSRKIASCVVRTLGCPQKSPCFCKARSSRLWRRRCVHEKGPLQVI